MAITQKDLAQRFNVSQGTISRALNGCKGVNGDLRRRILAAAQREDYPVRGERADDAPVATDVLCAIAYDEDDASGFNGRILRGMCRRGRELGREVVIVTHRLRELPLVVRRRQVDGVVRVLGDVDVYGGRTACPVPWVSVLYEFEGLDAVTVDNFRGTWEVGRHLCRLGHRRFAFIGPETEIARQRLAGLSGALAEAGLTLPPERVNLRRYAVSEELTRQLVDRMLSGHTPNTLPFSALVAYNDYMAVVAMEELRRCGWRVPEDVSVAGFDGVLPSWLRGPSVTTAAVPLEELGGEAVRLLLWRLQHPDARPWRVVLDCRFREGESTAAPLRP